jgi:hypothetical protein
MAQEEKQNWNMKFINNDNMGNGKSARSRLHYAKVIDRVASISSNRHFTPERVIIADTSRESEAIPV